jgi:hypothetical protein
MRRFGKWQSIKKTSRPSLGFLGSWAKLWRTYGAPGQREKSKQCGPLSALFAFALVSFLLVALRPDGSRALPGEKNTEGKIMRIAREVIWTRAGRYC